MNKEGQVVDKRRWDREGNLLPGTQPYTEESHKSNEGHEKQLALLKLAEEIKEAKKQIGNLQQIIRDAEINFQKAFSSLPEGERQQLTERVEPDSLGHHPIGYVPADHKKVFSGKLPSIGFSSTKKEK
ncbi:MAG: hypothetical protein HYT62_02130 [Candidatus Yanofskybacteria bacterium]|nr:hypothetical protein [Candidatus Yanofskybacteria bacterium]